MCAAKNLNDVYRCQRSHEERGKMREQAIGEASDSTEMEL